MERLKPGWADVAIDGVSHRVFVTHEPGGSWQMASDDRGGYGAGGTIVHGFRNGNALDIERAARYGSRRGRAQ